MEIFIRDNKEDSAIQYSVSTITNVESASYFVKAPTQLNDNSTEVGFDTKIALQTPPPTTPPQKLNVPTISAVTEPIVPKHCWLVYRLSLAGDKLSP